MSKTVKYVIACTLGIFSLIFGFCTRLTVPALGVLIGLKVFYSAYPLGWGATVAIPIACGAVCRILCFATAIAGKLMLEEG